MASDNRIVESTMIIHGRRDSRTITARSWSVGSEKSFTEYLSPAREQGTKMLKLEESVVDLFPATDRTIQISGHMLRQSVMGSDLSYEDMMDTRKLTDVYTAALEGEETIDGRPPGCCICRPAWTICLSLTKNLDRHRKVYPPKRRIICQKRPAAQTNYLF
jgi:hypothetical protein